MLNASAKSIRSRDERVFSQGARMDRMNMRVVREMIFFDQTFFLVGLSSGAKLSSFPAKEEGGFVRLLLFGCFCSSILSDVTFETYLFSFFPPRLSYLQCAPGRRSSRLLANRATTHEIRLEHSENHKGDEDGRRVSIETSPR